MLSPILRARTAGAAALVLAALQLAACNADVGRLADAADKARASTESMAAESRFKARQREIAILPQADEVHKGSPIHVAERYQVREGPDGYMVYDTETHSIARIQNDLLVGKQLEQAEDAVEALNNIDYRAKRGTQ